MNTPGGNTISTAELTFSMLMALARKIRGLYEKKQFSQKYGTDTDRGVVMDIRGILKIMPHRYPFLLVDRVTDFEPEIVADDVDSVKSKVTGIMCAAAELDVPLVVDVGSGSNWDEAH